jgi:ribosome-binding protein aMBF1 (putative translation factor)
MDHQDFKPVILNSKQRKDSEVIAKETQKRISQKVKDIADTLETVKIEADKKLGQQLSQARIAKGFNKQSDFVNEINSKSNLKISLQIYTKWESNKEIPTNEQIAQMEKILGVKLPRNKKVYAKDC